LDTEPAPSAPADDSGIEHPSVVMLVLDELPTKSLIDEQSRIDATRYPNLAALAAESTWYRHHTTLSPVTTNAVPSLLSGIEPTASAPTNEEHPDNLFSLLAPTHELEVLESATALCTYESCEPSIDESSSDAGWPDQLDLAEQVIHERILPNNASAAADDFQEEVVDLTTSTTLRGAVPSEGIAAFGGGQVLATPGRVEDLRRPSTPARGRRSTTST
jgi:hypothetical protein